MRRFQLLFLACFLFNCENKTANNIGSQLKLDSLEGKYSFPYIISKEDRLRKIKILKAGKSQDMTYITKNGFGYGYSYGNLIFWENDIYFYNLEFLNWSCSPFDSSRFDYKIFLEKNQLVRLPEKSIVDFIKLNTKEIDRKPLVIASFSDTIKNPIFNKLANSFDRVMIRRISEEEFNVINAIEKGIYYDPKDYKWESLTPPPKLDKTKFLPPK